MGFSPFRDTGLTHRDDRSAGGYTLVTPMGGGAMFLLDVDGRIVHRWKPESGSPGYGKMLPGGRVLCRLRGERPGAGAIAEMDWESNVVWSWDRRGSHHDFERLPNGNTVAIVSYRLDEEVATKVKGGTERPAEPRAMDGQPMGEETPALRGGRLGGDGMLGDSVLEVNPDGEIVNRWYAHEHLDFEVEVLCPLEGRREWLHANAVHVTPSGDLLLSFRQTSSVVCIRWPTGEVIWRHEPSQYSHQHNPTITPSGTLLVFDNATHRTTSRVVEVDLDTFESVWVYTGDPMYSFSSGHISGCERLWNGNTMICEGETGRVFEVTPDKQVCWEWVNPFLLSYTGRASSSQLFRAHRYAADSPELAGMRIDPGDEIERINREAGLVA